MAFRSVHVLGTILLSVVVVTRAQVQDDNVTVRQSLPMNYDPFCTISGLFLEYNIHNTDNDVSPSRMELTMGSTINLDTLVYTNGTGINIVAETDFSNCTKPVQCVQLKLGPYIDDESLIKNSVHQPPYVLYSDDADSEQVNKYYPSFIGWMNVYATAYSTLECTGNPNTNNAVDDGNDIRTAVQAFRTIQLLRNSTDPDDTTNSTTTTNTTCALPNYYVYNASNNMVDPLIVYQQNRWPYQSRILLDQYSDMSINILVDYDTSECTMSPPPIIRCVTMQLGNFTNTTDSNQDETLQRFELFPTPNDSDVMITTDAIQYTGWQLLTTNGYTTSDCTGGIVASSTLNIDFVPVSEQGLPMHFVARYTAPPSNITTNTTIDSSGQQPSEYTDRVNASDVPSEMPILPVLTRPPTIAEVKHFINTTCTFLRESYKTIHPPNLLHVGEKYKCYGKQLNSSMTNFNNTIEVKFTITPTFRINPIVETENNGVATLPTGKTLYHDLVLLFTDALCTVNCMSSYVRSDIPQPVETNYYYPFVQQYSTVVPVVKSKNKMYKFDNPFIANYIVPNATTLTNGNATRNVVKATCQYISKVLHSGWYDTQFISFNHSQFKCWRQLPEVSTPYQIMYRIIPSFTFGQYNAERNFNGNLLDFPEMETLVRDINYMFMDEKKIKNNDNSGGGDGGITMSTYVKAMITATNPYANYTSIEMS